MLDLGAICRPNQTDSFYTKFDMNRPGTFGGKEVFVKY